jgi:hypothetical protein
MISAHGAKTGRVDYFVTAVLPVSNPDDDPVLLAISGISAELFRYRGAARDGGTLEYIFESEEQDVPKTATKERWQ